MYVNMNTHDQLRDVVHLNAVISVCKTHVLLYEAKKSLGGILSNGFQKLLSKIHGEIYLRFTSTKKPSKH